MSDGFDPTNVATYNGNFFAFPYMIEQSDIVLVPVPWDVTTSFRAGTALGPKAIIAASSQLDFFDFNIEKVWETKIGTASYSVELEEHSRDLRLISEKIIQKLEKGESIEDLEADLAIVNKACESLNKMIHRKTAGLMEQGKLVGVVGGDHSVPLGFIQALSEKYDNFGILHIDAHADLRPGYEGFNYSHASIMYHAVQCESVSRLVQVAIRDLGHHEFEYADSNPKIVQFPDTLLKENQFNGFAWRQQCVRIISELPENVYVSFDIDGLSPEFCPSTGTPVPGGLTYDQALFLIETLRKSGKKIIGFDLCETAPDEYDAIIGAHLLFRLVVNMKASNK
ncbi:MAG: agmatinase family protein [Bacteroidales bacterium]|jgi:agmatinase|nr:agmatinase family protein [Bacteroidales bacterium]